MNERTVSKRSGIAIATRIGSGRGAGFRNHAAAAPTSANAIAVTASMTIGTPRRAAPTGAGSVRARSSSMRTSPMSR
jgi:hypothetical protein